MSKDTDLGNRFVRVIGLLGFIFATVAFLLILSGVPTVNEPENPAGVVLFNAFIMCAALAFAGIMITTLAQISDTLRNIEAALTKQEKKPAAKKAAAPAKKKTAKKDKVEA